MRNSLLLSTVLISPSCFGAINLDSTKVVEISVSDKGLTRISVEKQRIRDVFVHPANLEKNISLHKSGHVFLTPEGLKDAVHLSVITEQGDTQDLKIKFVANKNPQPVILQVVKKKEDAATTPQDLTKVLHAYMSGTAPKGYWRLPAVARARKGHGMEFTVEDVWTNGQHRLIKLSASNATDDPIELNQEEFSTYGDVAVVLSQRSIAPGATCNMFIIRNEENN